MKVVVIDLSSHLHETGGGQKVASWLYNGLSRHFDTYYLGYRTSYLHGGKNTIMLGYSKDAEPDRIKKMSGRNSRLAMYDITIGNRLGFMDPSKEEVLERLRKLKPEVVIANGRYDYYLVKFLRESGLRFKSVYVDHAQLSEWFTKREPHLRFAASMYVRINPKKFFGLFDACVAINRKQERALRKFTDRVRYIPNGVSERPKRNSVLDEKARVRYGISKGSFAVLYIGRMEESQKNVSTLIKAFAGIEDRDLRLLLVGHGPSADYYKELAGRDKRIVFAGKVEDSMISSIYDISNLFVLPSFREGFSITILEAASHSIPMVLSSGAYIEDLKSERIGRISSFEPGDVAELRRLITTLAKDKGMLRKASMVSRKVANEFSESRMIDGYRKLILDMQKGMRIKE